MPSKGRWEVRLQFRPVAGALPDKELVLSRIHSKTTTPSNLIALHQTVVFPLAHYTGDYEAAAYPSLFDHQR